MANFTIETAQYARSLSGLTKANNNAKDYLMNKIGSVAAHTNEVYNEFRKVVKDNWNGEDAEKYLDLVEKKRNALWYHIRDDIANPLFNDESGILKQDFNEFRRNQQRTI